MSSQATTVDAIDHRVEDRETFPAGVSWGKLMMWLFLCSDAMSFGALIAAYAAFRYMDPGWPNPLSILGINLTAIMTFILIVSSVTMVTALDGIKKGNVGRLKVFLGWTIAGGLFFLGCQAYEWTHLIHHKGLAAPNRLFDATFFIMTGFHGLHVTGGVIYNSIILLLARKGRYSAERHDQVEIAGLYWHFVDLVWILIFTFVYLIPSPTGG